MSGCNMKQWILDVCRMNKGMQLLMSDQGVYANEIYPMQGAKDE